MDTLKRLSKFESTYRGINWPEEKCPIAIQPKNSLIFCDLRGYIFDGLDLSNVEFFGCLLNGASFREAILDKSKFLYCFSSPDYAPTDFRTAKGQNVKAENSHLSCLWDSDKQPNWLNGDWDDSLMIGDRVTDGLSWPQEEVAAAAGKMLSKRNNDRYHAAAELGNLGNPVAAPILGCMLADPEWDVRSSALEALEKLSPWEFFNADLRLLKWMLFRLGDEHSIVRHKASDLIETLSQYNINLLFRLIDEMLQSPLLTEQLNAVAIAIELSELDDEYLSLLERDDVKKIVFQEFREVPEQCSHLLRLIEDAKEDLLSDRDLETGNLETGAKNLQEHDRWLAEHLDDLIDKHPGKIVAVIDGEIVGIGDSYKEVYAPFQNQNRDWMPFAVRVPHHDDVQEFIL